MTLIDIGFIFCGIGLALTASRYFIKKPENFVLTFLQNTVGTFFIFSGFIKLIDPLGFSYKLNDYWDVFNMPFLKDYSLAMSCFVTIFEIVLGVTLLLGFEMFWTTLSLLLMILFFLFLTWYSAYYNKVTDCGCFGDFMKLKPWHSFYKDVVLTAMILPLFIWRKKISGWFSCKTNIVITVVAFLGLAGLQYYCYNHLPIIDFRAYKIGTNICEASKLPPGAKEDIFETKLYYKNLKSGEVKEFTTKDYPWQDTLNWKFSDRKSILIEEGDHAPIHDFILTTTDGVEVTDSLLNIEGKHFFVIMYDVDKTDRKLLEKVNKLYEECAQKQVSLVGLASGDGASGFAAESGAKFPIYLCDGTALKTVIRSNPGLLLLEKCTVKNMWHGNDIPALEKALQ